VKRFGKVQLLGDPRGTHPLLQQDDSVIDLQPQQQLVRTLVVESPKQAAEIRLPHMARHGAAI
jgi:hypothetical protein